MAKKEVAIEEVVNVEAPVEAPVEEFVPYVAEDATVKVIAKETRTVYWGQEFVLVEGKEIEIPFGLKEEWEKLGLCK